MTVRGNREDGIDDGTDETLEMLRRLPRLDTPSPASPDPILTPTPSATATAPAAPTTSSLHASKQANQGKPAPAPSTSTGIRPQQDGGRLPGECNLISVLHILLSEYVFSAAAAVAVTPAWPLPRPALKINLPASPFALQSLSLPLPAAPHRGVFRGADVTVHVTAPPGPGLSMYRESKESQQYQAILCSLSGVVRSRSTQVPERHGYPRSRKLPSTYGMGTERLPGHVPCTYTAPSPRRQQSFEVSSPIHLILQLAAKGFVFASSCHWADLLSRRVTESQTHRPLPHCRCQEKCRGRKRARERALSSEAQPSARQTGFSAARLPVATHTSC